MRKNDKNYGTPDFYEVDFGIFAITYKMIVVEPKKCSLIVHCKIEEIFKKMFSTW